MRDEEDREDNIKAANELIHKAAAKGNKVCGAYFSFKDLVNQLPGGGYLSGTAQDYDEENDDDDIRPY